MDFTSIYSPRMADYREAELTVRAERARLAAERAPQPKRERTVSLLTRLRRRIGHGLRPVTR